MNYQFFLLSFLFFTLPFFVLSQDSTAMQQYNSNSIYIQSGFSGNKYIKNATYYPRGFMGSKIKKELAISPNAIIEFKKYRNNQLAATILTSVSIGLLYASIYSDNSNTDLPILLSLGGTTIASVLSIKSQNHLQKSIWLYNRDILR